MDDLQDMNPQEHHRYFQLMMSSSGYHIQKRWLQLNLSSGKCSDLEHMGRQCHPL